MNDGLSSMEKVPTTVVVNDENECQKVSYNEGLGNINKLQLHDEAHTKCGDSQT